MNRMLLQTTISSPPLHHHHHQHHHQVSNSRLLLQLGSLRQRPHKQFLQHYSGAYITTCRAGRQLDFTTLPSLQIHQREMAAGFYTSANPKTGGQLLPRSQIYGNKEKIQKKKRVFFLDVNPLCYAGSTPSLKSFGYWISLFFSQVSHTDPVIAVLDGEGGNEHRRQLLPSYKMHRRKFLHGLSVFRKFSKDHVGRLQVVVDVLTKCNVPVVKIEGQEADDVVATLARQVLERGYQVVIASPDKDFKQLISDNVQIVMPITELHRWSFYTLKHYMAQYGCHPCCDLSLRCMLGDEVDGVPGIQDLVPGFGRKTAQKLLKKHGSLENLLSAAAVKTVGRPYAQDALTKHADYLRRNYEVLALKRDVDVHLNEEWLVERGRCNDSTALSDFLKLLEQSRKHTRLNSHSSIHDENHCLHSFANMPKIIGNE